MLAAAIGLWVYGGRLKKDPGYMDNTKFPRELAEQQA